MQNFGWSEYIINACLGEKKYPPSPVPLTVTTGNVVWGVYAKLASLYHQFHPFPMASKMDGNGWQQSAFAHFLWVQQRLGTLCTAGGEAFPTATTTSTPENHEASSLASSFPGEAWRSLYQFTMERSWTHWLSALKSSFRGSSVTVKKLSSACSEVFITF